jgi:hypothetical protein
MALIRKRGRMRSTSYTTPTVAANMRPRVCWDADGSTASGQHDRVGRVRRTTPRRNASTTHENELLKGRCSEHQRGRGGGRPAVDFYNTEAA